MQSTIEKEGFKKAEEFVNQGEDKFKAIAAEAQRKLKLAQEHITQMATTVDKKVKDYKLDFIKKNPDSFVSKIFISSKDPDVPKAPILSNGRKDSVFEYNVYKEHYWDNIDFSDDSENILRTDMGGLVEFGQRQLVRSPHQPAIA